MTTAIFTNPEVKRRFRLAYDSPTDFARLFLAVTPTEQQKQLFEAIAKPGAKVAVRSGHGIGKSTALAVLALWFLCTRRDAKIPCSAPTAHQLQDVLWSEMRRLHGRMPEWMKSQFQISNDKITRDGSAGYIVARTARPESPEALQGFHADNILFLLDEASGIHDSIFEVARGALSTPDARVVMTGNPTQLTGYFYNAFHIARDTWTRFQFSCLDSPRVDPSYARDIAKEYGDDSDMYRVRVLGEFPKIGLNSMISAERVQLAFERKMPVHEENPAPRILGVDPAWEGSDRSVIVFRQGRFAKVLFVGRGLDGPKLGQQVIRFQDEYSPTATFLDKTGVGTSCYDYLRQLQRVVTGVSFAESPLHPDRFLNRRAEIWWSMREWFEEDVCLTFHNDLLNDLVAPEYSVNPLGKIQLESKESMRKRGVASPDLGDALALTFTCKPGSGAGVFMNPHSKTYDPYRRLNKRRN